MNDETKPQDVDEPSPASTGSVDHRRQLRVRDWRGGNVDLWIDEDGDFGIMKAEARRSLVIRGSDIQKIAAWLGGTSLTDLEREAIECGIQAIGLAPRDDRTLAFADTLQRLLERTK